MMIVEKLFTTPGTHHIRSISPVHVFCQEVPTIGYGSREDRYEQENDLDILDCNKVT